MTRANTEQQKHTPWFAKAGAACSIAPISRAVGPIALALKGADTPFSYRHKEPIPKVSQTRSLKPSTRP